MRPFRTKEALLIFSLLTLACASCEKKKNEPTPTVRSSPSVSSSPTMTEKAEDALKVATDKTKAAAAAAAEKSKEVANDVKAWWDRKRVEWRLTDGDIKSDLEKTGRVVREKSAVAGEKIASAADNVRIVTVIKAKLLTDSDLSALKIDVDADHSVVTLKGSVKSLQLVGRATALALDTEGVTRVVALLHVEP